MTGEIVAGVLLALWLWDLGKEWDQRAKEREYELQACEEAEYAVKQMEERLKPYRFCNGCGTALGSERFELGPGTVYCFHCWRKVVSQR